MFSWISLIFTSIALAESRYGSSSNSPLVCCRKSSRLFLKKRIQWVCCVLFTVEQCLHADGGGTEAIDHLQPQVHGCRWGAPEGESDVETTAGHTEERYSLALGDVCRASYLFLSRILLMSTQTKQRRFILEYRFISYYCLVLSLFWQESWCIISWSNIVFVEYIGWIQTKTTLF